MGYTSFKQIKADLDILKVEKDIEYHKMVHSLEKSKERLTFNNLVSGAISSASSKITNPYLALVGTVLPFAISQIFPLIKNWFKRND